ncbi:MAG: Mth938-like domain-containing protein [Planctomycetota bacterium]
MSESPVVTHLSWGRIETLGQVFKDVKLWPGGARGWDWGETGTRHVPGVQLADAQELVDRGAEVVVLSRGVQLVLQVPDATVAALRAPGVEVVVAQTEEAARRYEELRAAGARVGALLHSTC